MSEKLNELVPSGRVTTGSQPSEVIDSWAECVRNPDAWRRVFWRERRGAGIVLEDFLSRVYGW